MLGTRAAGVRCPCSAPAPAVFLSRRPKCSHPHISCSTGEVVLELEALFKDHPDLVGDVFAIPRARIPVIKALWKPTGTKVCGYWLSAPRG